MNLKAVIFPQKNYYNNGNNKNNSGGSGYDGDSVVSRLTFYACLIAKTALYWNGFSYSVVFCLWGEMALEALTQWGSRDPTGGGGSLKRRECKDMTGIAEGI